MKLTLFTLPGGYRKYEIIDSKFSCRDLRIGVNCCCFPYSEKFQCVNYAEDDDGFQFPDLHTALVSDLVQNIKIPVWEHHHHYSERMRNKLFVLELRWNDAFLHKEKSSRATTIFLILLKSEEKKKDLVMTDCSHRGLGKARMCVPSVSHIFWCVMFLSGRKN